MESREIALKNLNLADHILTQTYPYVKDPKILLVSIENIYKATMATVDLILEEKREKKEIPPYHNNRYSKLNAFKTTEFSEKFGEFIEHIITLRDEHKKSPVEFQRKEKFVICSDEYDIRTISEDQMKKFLSTARLFLKEANKK